MHRLVAQVLERSERLDVVVISPRYAACRTSPCRRRGPSCISSTTSAAQPLSTVVRSKAHEVEEDAARALLLQPRGGGTRTPSSAPAPRCTPSPAWRGGRTGMESRGNEALDHAEIGDRLRIRLHRGVEAHLREIGPPASGPERCSNRPRRRPRSCGSSGRRQGPFDAGSNSIPPQPTSVNVTARIAPSFAYTARTVSPRQPCYPQPS